MARKVLDLAAPPYALPVKVGDTVEFKAHFDYIGPAISANLYVAIGRVGAFGWFDEIVYNTALLAIPATATTKRYQGHTDIYISSKLTPGDYDVYAKLINIPGPDIFSPFYENIIKVVEEYTLTTKVSPTGAGRITKEPDKTKYEFGESVKLTDYPYSGYEFSYWDSDGELLSYGNPINFMVMASHTLTAHFKEEAPPPPPPPPEEEEEFTATQEQCEEIQETATPEEYDAAIDSAYDAAEAEAEATDGVVAWSADEGFHVITWEEAQSPEYW